MCMGMEKQQQLMSSLPSPGEVLILDYRESSPSVNSEFQSDEDNNFVCVSSINSTPISIATNNTSNKMTSSVISYSSFNSEELCNSDECTKYLPKLKTIQWNIERGYSLSKIISILKNIDADIICLQELDIGCQRSDFANTFDVIAKELKLIGAFVAEFEELHSPLRSARTQGGGVHGNAIFSKYELVPNVIDHIYHPFDWEASGHTKKEPRKGRRYTLYADVVVPGLDVPVLVYSVHLEVFCGIIGRIQQFGEILAHSKALTPSRPYQLLYGDLNTMGHSIARFSPAFCSDNLRWRTVGRSEGEWWMENIFNSYVKHGPINTYLWESLGASGYLSKKDCEDLRNPGFYDPFDVSKDNTLINYGGLYRGKLDWSLIRGFKTCSKTMVNLDFKASDHRALVVEIEAFEHDQIDLQLDSLFSAPPWKKKLAFLNISIMVTGVVLGFFALKQLAK